MDVDFWAARVHSANHPTACDGNNINMEDEEVRAWFPCPFCYVEIEVPILCLHLQEEHYFDMKNAVCPICAANLEKDTISHFTMQHAHSVKRRNKSQNSGFWSCNVSPILTPFLCTVPKHVHKDIYTSSSVAATTDAERTILYKDVIGFCFAVGMIDFIVFAAARQLDKMKLWDKIVRKEGKLSFKNCLFQPSSSTCRATSACFQCCKSNRHQGFIFSSGASDVYY